MSTNEPTNRRLRRPVARKLSPTKLLAALKDEAASPGRRRSRIRWLLAKLYEEKRYQKLGYRSLPSLVHNEIGKDDTTAFFESYAAVVESLLYDVKLNEFKTGTMRPLFALKDEPDLLQSAFEHAVKMAGGREKVIAKHMEIAVAHVQGKTGDYVVAYDAKTAVQTICNIVDVLGDGEGIGVLADVIAKHVACEQGVQGFQAVLRQRLQ